MHQALLFKANNTFHVCHRETGTACCTSKRACFKSGVDDATFDNVPE